MYSFMMVWNQPEFNGNHTSNLYLDQRCAISYFLKTLGSRSKLQVLVTGLSIDKESITYGIFMVLQRVRTSSYYRMSVYTLVAVWNKN